MLRKRIVLMLFNLKLKKNKSQEGSLVHPHSTLRYNITKTRLIQSLTSLKSLPGSSVFRVPTLEILVSTIGAL